GGGDERDCGDHRERYPSHTPCPHCCTHVTPPSYRSERRPYVVLSRQASSAVDGLTPVEPVHKVTTCPYRSGPFQTRRRCWWESGSRRRSDTCRPCVRSGSSFGNTRCSRSSGTTAPASRR